MPALLPLAVFLALVAIALFGLLRLSLARRGTHDDWQALVAFGRLLPPVTPWTAASPTLWSEVLGAAPPGVVADGGGGPLTAENAYERVRTHQSTLQSEMKWYVRRMTSPFQWFVAGVRGFALAPFGLAFDVDARTRAERRRLEAHADFQRAVTAVLAVVLFVVLVASWFALQDGMLAWRRFARG